MHTVSGDSLSYMIDSALEAPRHPFRFTKENAKAFSVQGWQASVEARKQMKADAEKVRLATPQAVRLANILEGIEQDLLTARDPDKRSKLATAYDKLFGRWQVLTGTPNPGSRRANKRNNAQPDVQPMTSPEPVTPQANDSTMPIPADKSPKSDATKLWDY